MKITFLIKNMITALSLIRQNTHVLSLTMLLSIVPSGATLAHDVTVNITGTITNTTCSLSADSINAQVNLGMFLNASKPRPGTSSPPVAFSINLEHCGAVSKGVQVSFSGTPDTDTPSYFKNDLSTSDSASGFAVKLMDENKTLIPVGNTTKAYYITGGATTKSLLFYAQMVETSSTIKTGMVRSTVTFQTLYP